MQFLVPAIALCLLVLGACSNQQFYEGLKAQHDVNCLNYPDAGYRECMEESSDSFEEYQQQRDEVQAK